MTAITGTSQPPRARRPMGVWRLEWLRMIRSPRALTLGAVYLAFGLLGPVMAKYMANIVGHVQSSIQIIVPPPTPKDGITNFVSQVSQTGLIVVVVIAAGALTFDSRRGLSTFLRTRAPTMWSLVVPRYTVNAVAAVFAYAVGTLGAWYETVLLLGTPSAGAMLTGLLCGAMYLVFAVAVVAAAASFARGTLGTVGIALAVLLLLPIVGSLAALHYWLPSTLASAPVELLGTTTLADYLPALLVAALASFVLVWTAVVRLAAREI